ncbi:MAG TPA: RNA methyltransferase [Candidatus Limnocylindrales bacterium]|nr:RNA methyltransferase [Candidatus Limnocylindrales bacterium]
MTVLESPRNPRVRAAAELRDRRHRDRTGLTLVDGVREVARALDAGVEAVEVFASPERLGRDPEGRALAARLASGSVPVHPSSDAVLERIGFGDRAEGVVAVVRIPPLGLDRLQLPPDALVVVLERVEKPGNLGAAMRSADGAGASAVILADPLTDLFNPNAIRASLGTIFALPVASAPAPAVLEYLLGAGIVPWAARVDAQALYTDADLAGASAVVLGSEAHGLSATWSDPRVRPVRLPMLGVADSLNVSIAAAVLLYEARRQRGSGRPPGP